MSNESPSVVRAPAETPGRGVTRDQLYELAWTVPMRTLAERFSMSDRGLAKLCERHAIPTPGRGYWRLKETGHPARRLPLPKLHPTHQGLATVQLPEAQVIVRPVAKPESPPDPPRVAAQRAFEEANPIVVGDLPDRPHPLVRATRAGLRKLKDGTTDRQQASGELSLDLAVTAATRDRGLRILEALCRAFKQRGWPVAARQGDRLNSQIEVFGIKIAFSLEERLQQRERPTHKPMDRFLDSSLLFQPRYDHIPTGELVLKAWHDTGFKSKWADGKRQRVENKLNDFMVAVACMADNEIRWQEERVIRERRQREEELLRWERQRRQEEEDRRGKDLAQLADRWRESEELRAFVAAVRARLVVPGGNFEDMQLERWLRWADGYTNRLDPLSFPEALPPPYVRQPLWAPTPAVEWPPTKSNQAAAVGVGSGRGEEEAP